MTAACLYCEASMPAGLRAHICVLCPAVILWVAVEVAVHPGLSFCRVHDGIVDEDLAMDMYQLICQQVGLAPV